jgi:septal ring factor EnvC (AmiA/AmiB activator)
MLILDDILLFPVRGVLWIFRELHKAAQEELATEAETITAELRELYMMLETRKITEAEFEARERELLDRLEVLERRDGRLENQPDQPPVDSRISRKPDKAAREELAKEAEAIATRLRELQGRVETDPSLTKAEFDARERKLLRRVKETGEPGAPGGGKRRRTTSGQ